MSSSASGWGGARPGTGAPANNDHAERHGLRAEPDSYVARLSVEEQVAIERLEDAIQDRAADDAVKPARTARRVAIRLHKLMNAAVYLADRELAEHTHVLAEMRRTSQRVYADLNRLEVI